LWPVSLVSTRKHKAVFLDGWFHLGSLLGAGGRGHRENVNLSALKRLSILDECA